jgi:hypothetical protein
MNSSLTYVSSHETALSEREGQRRELDGHRVRTSLCSLRVCEFIRARFCDTIRALPGVDASCSFDVRIR